jgi:segregation and condensation protein A
VTAQESAASLRYQTEDEESSRQKEGVEILVDMARAGELDPWNVDIVAVADAYLMAVNQMQANDLKVTGKTLLYLAVLLRMKSEQLSGRNPLEMIDADHAHEADPSWDESGPSGHGSLSNLLDLTQWFGGNKGELFQNLGALIQRRPSVKQPRVRRVTLKDLIDQLQQIEVRETHQSIKETVKRVERRRVKDYSRLTADDIEALAHEELAEEAVLTLQHVLEALWLKSRELGITPTITLDALESDFNLDRVPTYIALLHMVARGEVDIEQSEIYGDLLISPLLSAPLIADDATNLDLPELGAA